MSYYEDISKLSKDTEEVESIREGPTMQSKDNQPGEDSTSQQPGEGISEPQEMQAGEASQGVQSEQADATLQQSGQRVQQPEVDRYQGASEHIPFVFPEAPAVSYQPGPVASYQSPPTSGGTGWMYPPRPEQYQVGRFGQSDMRARAAITQPLPPLASGQLPYQSGSVHTAQPGLGAFRAGSASQRVNRQQRSGMRTGALVALGLLLAAIFASGLISGWALSRTTGSDSSTTSSNSFQPGKSSTVTVPQLTGNNADAVREAVINKVQPSIVQIDIQSGSQQALGSGVVIDGRGYIVTNGHVVTGASVIEVMLADNSQHAAQLVGVDAADDLAVVKIAPPTDGLTVASFGDSAQLKVGQTVMAIGSPLGNAETVTSGIVSALNRNVSESQSGPTLPDAIQTDAPINPGNSGGALVNMQGEFVGMPTLNAINNEFNTPANGLGFAIPSNRIKFIAQQLVATGHVAHTGRPLLGVTITSVDQSVASQNNLSITYGALIVKLTAGGPAASAGLQTNDVIVQLGNQIVHSTTDLSASLLTHKPGENLALKVYRGTQPLTLTITLGELSAN